MINEFRAQLDFTRVTNAEPVQDLRICVCVRKRPINKKETSKKENKDPYNPDFLKKLGILVDKD